MFYYKVNHVSSLWNRVLRGGLLILLLMSVLTLVSGTVKGDEPGRGLTAQFEINYLKFIIDHHYSALRITELAAGTDVTRATAISPSEGTSPSPTFSATAAKATLDEIKSLARRANRMQRPQRSVEV